MVCTMPIYFFVGAISLRHSSEFVCICMVWVQSKILFGWYNGRRFRRYCLSYRISIFFRRTIASLSQIALPNSKLNYFQPSKSTISVSSKAFFLNFASVIKLTLSASKSPQLLTRSSTWVPGAIGYSKLAVA